MQPVDVVGRLIVVDFGRESVSPRSNAIDAEPETASISNAVAVPDLSQLSQNGTADERRPDVWQPLGYVLKRVVARLLDPRQ